MEFTETGRRPGSAPVHAGSQAALYCCGKSTIVISVCRMAAFAGRIAHNKDFSFAAVRRIYASTSPREGTAIQQPGRSKHEQANRFACRSCCRRCVATHRTPIRTTKHAGSRRSPARASSRPAPTRNQPISIIDRADHRTHRPRQHRRPAAADVSAGGKALNAKFNSSGNFGYPADGGGIGAGSAQVDLRNLSSQARAGARRRHPLGQRVLRFRRVRRGRPQHHPDEHHRPHRGARRRRLGHLRFRRHRRRRQHHHAQEFRRRRAQCATAANSTSAARPPMPASRSAAAARNSTACSSPATTSRKASAPASGSSRPSRSRSRASRPAAPALPQGRFTFCDPARPAGTDRFLRRSGRLLRRHAEQRHDDAGLEPGESVGSGNYHDFGGADRFNFAPYNLLLTPSERKSMFASMSLRSHRQRAALREGTVQQPQVDQPGRAGADLRRSRSRAPAVSPTPSRFPRSIPYNPFGIDLDAGSNLGWVTRRPLEVGPRIFTQDVDTWYANVGSKVSSVAAIAASTGT